MLDLVKISSMQLDLDKYINEHHDTTREERVSKKLLALKQELGEVVQEMPEWFKFWSNKKNNLEAAQKEFSDVLHFTISIGNEICYPFGKFKQSNISGLDVCAFMNDFYSKIPSYFEYITYKDYGTLLSYALELGDVLYLSEEEIEENYRRKWEINFKRQDEGY